MQEKLKNKKGITLVALIITVIILLILAGVTISLIIGDNGMVTKAKQGVEQSEIASIREQADLVRSEQGIRTFEEKPQELTKSSYINALNVSFEGSIVEGSRVIVKDKKYAIFVKSNLEIEILRNDGKELANGELRLDYDVSEDGLIEIYPRIGGVQSYKMYAEKILAEKTPQDKKKMFVEEELRANPDDYNTVDKTDVDTTLSGILAELGNYANLEDLAESWGCKSVDDMLIKSKYVEPEGYNFDKYCEIEITCPDGSKIVTDTYSIKYQTYEKGKYTFIGKVEESKVKEGKVEEGTDEVTVVVDNAEKASLNLKINVPENNYEIQLPVYTEPDKDYEYDFEVEWGDGEEKQTINDISTTTHTYANGGTYTIKIVGKYEGLHVGWDNESMKKVLVGVEQWGATGLKEIYLSDCPNLIGIASPTTNSFANMQNFNNSFNSCTGLTSIPQDLFANCPNVTGFEGTFSGCSSLTGKPIQLWNEGRKGIDENNGGSGCYSGCTKLDDYGNIPSYWRNGIG